MRTTTPVGRSFSTGFPVVIPMAALLASCGGGRSLETVDTPFEGPRITARVVDDQHRVVVFAPTPGWRVSLDAVDIRERTRDAFITLERPNPAFMYPQMIVEQQIATGIDAALGMSVFARLVDFNSTTGVYAPVTFDDASSDVPVPTPPGDE